MAKSCLFCGSGSVAYCSTFIVRKINLPSAPSKEEIYHDNVLIWRSINIILN